MNPQWFKGPCIHTKDSSSIRVRDPNFGGAHSVPMFREFRSTALFPSRLPMDLLRVHASVLQLGSMKASSALYGLGLRALGDFAGGIIAIVSEHYYSYHECKQVRDSGSG